MFGPSDGDDGGDFMNGDDGFVAADDDGMLGGPE